MACGTQRVHILIMLEWWCWVSGLQTVPECRFEYDGKKQARSMFALKGIQT